MLPELFCVVAAEVSLIGILANWPQQRCEHWIFLLNARAIENQCWILGVNHIGVDSSGLRFVGDSMVVYPLEKVLYHMNAYDVLKNVTIDPQKVTLSKKSFSC
ncbi:MAG: hypothetical protein PHE86_05315 [Candidatus Marinimicrobia bacterium]|nr:hypothetical protein [Candidatus Neomarinimicrobiota bacterium]MDD5583174.1 hypothetical protein [Candidatus Neomarinimicrobiota bacterium]